MSQEDSRRNTTPAAGTVGEAIATARRWVRDRIAENPDMVCAYLAGSLNRLPADAPMPESSDVDIHVIQRHRGTWVAAEAVRGLLLQCTVQDIDLSSRDAVLGHAFEAQPLLFGTILADPRGQLASVRRNAYADFSDQRWVKERCEGAIASAHEWFGMIHPENPSGIDGAVPLFAWATSSLAACLAVARLREPGGRKCLLTAGEVLVQAGRRDLYDRFLSLLGVASFTEAQVLRYHVESMRLFDRAIQVHRTFVPGDAQLRPSYRTYLETGVEEILAGGFHREAMWRIQRTYFPACQVLIADAREDERPHYRTMWDAFQAHLGLSTPEHVRNRLHDGHGLAQEVKDVALHLASA